MNSAGPCRILGRIACGLLLPMFRGLCVSVSLLDTTAASPAEADEPIDMPFGLWTRLQSPRERGAHLGGGVRCGLLTEFFDHLLSVYTLCALAVPLETEA